MAELNKKDMILTLDAAARFALGADEVEGSVATPVLGVNVHDAKALKSINWDTAGLFGGKDNRDWILLGAKDIQSIDSVQKKPEPLRLWIPVLTGILDPWFDNSPRKLEVRRVKNGSGAFPLFEKTPLFTVGLQTRNDWAD